MIKRIDSFARTCFMLAGFAAILGVLATDTVYLTYFGIGSIVCCLLEVLCAVTPAVFALLLAFKKKPGYALCVAALVIVWVNPIGRLLSPVATRLVTNHFMQWINSLDSYTVSAGEILARYSSARNLLSAVLSFFTPFFYVGAGVKLVTSRLDDKPKSDPTEKAEGF